MSAGDRLINKVSVTASLVLAVVLSASTVVVVWPRVASALGLQPARVAVRPAYVPGDRIDVPASWYQRAPRTLVVFARSSCGACQNAQPFLKSLVADVETHGGAVVLAGHRDTPQSDAEFARSLGLTDAAFTVFPAGLRLKATPTLVLVNRAGTIVHAWEGVGPAEQQAAIATAILAALK